MKKIKALLSKPAFLLAAAALLLVMSAVGSAQAALTYYSENYSAQVSVDSIGVSLMENGERISYRDYKHSGGEWNTGTGKLLEDLARDEKNSKVVPGKAYGEKLSVMNSGDIDSYVRVILYRDWQDGKGSRETALSPELIDLHLCTEDGWVIDEKASTRERIVLYYTKILPAKETTPDLSDTIRIDPSITKYVKDTVSVNEEGYKTITTKYLYDDYRFNLTAEVDAVQTHNAREAIKSAWGVDVDVAADGALTLQQ